MDQTALMVLMELADVGNCERCQSEFGWQMDLCLLLLLLLLLLSFSLPSFPYCLDFFSYFFGGGGHSRHVISWAPEVTFSVVVWPFCVKLRWDTVYGLSVQQAGKWSSKCHAIVDVCMRVVFLCIVTYSFAAFCCRATAVFNPK